MVRKSKMIGFVLLVVLATNAAGLAQGNVSAQVTADFFTKYVWRGQNVVDDVVFQPGISVSHSCGLSGGLWANMDMTDENGTKGNFTELDFYVDYGADIPGIDGLSFNVGAIYYDFPQADFGTTELYWGFAWDVILSPSITVYHDIDKAEGLYVSAGIGHSFENILELGSDCTIGLDIGASIGYGDNGYNDFYWGVKDGEFNDLVISASFPMALGDWLVTPSVSYMYLLGSNVRDSDAYGDDDGIFIAGVGLVKSIE